MSKVDPNEAPEGCTAAPAKKIVDFDWDYYECGECHFNDGSINEICDRAECSAETRKDGCNVIFVKRSSKATAQIAWEFEKMEKAA